MSVRFRPAATGERWTLNMVMANVGLIGLAVMGQNLVLNMERNGYRVAVYNRTESRTKDFVNGAAKGKAINAAYTLEEFVNALERPRKVIVMVQAGGAVDAVIDQLTPLLDSGDVIVDGGNSYYKDTIRRAEALEKQGIHFLGAGISGGEEGALNGPSIMPGGSKEAWNAVASILTDISAKVNGEPCCAYLGEDGVGHFVKMVHNGIEYGDMQLITEAYFLMQRLVGMEAGEMAPVFHRWNEGELQSYLIEITGEILEKVDPETGKPLVDVILDEAGHKGTGKWTSQEALDLGVPAPTITEAVYARYISAIKSERVIASTKLKGPDPSQMAKEGLGPFGDAESFIEAVGQALYAAKICSYAQGFALLDQAAEAYGWDLDLGVVSSLWRGGCIIRAQFLDRIKEAYQKGDLKNLLLDDYFAEVVQKSQEAWRGVVSVATLAGIPVPGFSSALAYYDLYRHDRLPANLLQAQRDYFGAHTYRRIDREGTFHTDWLNA